MADEPRRSVRATKGQHTKSLDVLDQPAEPKKKATKKGSKKAAAEEEVEIIRCVCGATEQQENDIEAWIACDRCEAWQHNVCVGLSSYEEDTPDKYLCEQCGPEFHTELLEGIKRGEKPWEDRRRAWEKEMAEEGKGKKGKKGKGKRTSDPKEIISKALTEAKPPSVPAEDVKKEKKETVARAGSTKRKTRDEPQDKESAKGPQPKIRKVSAVHTTPQQKSPPSDLPAKIIDLEHSRQGGAKLVHKGLLYAIPIAVQSQIYQYSLGDTLETKAERLAIQVEDAIWNTHPDKAAYNKQARALFSNLKINQELCNGLLTKSLAPRALAVMTSDEMASKEKKREEAEMKARSDKQSIMVTENDGPRMRRTHKGDEVIEEDNFTVPNDNTMSTSRRRSMLDPNGDMVSRSRENSPGNEVELPENIDDYRSRDNIRAHVAPKQPLNVDTKPSQPPMRKASTQGDFDINKVFSSVQSPTAAQHHIRRPSSNIAPPANGPGVDPEIDKLLQDDDGNESPPYSPAEYNSDPDIIWRGIVHMESVAKFPAVAKHVAGADLSRQIPWSDILQKDLRVAGRIDQEKANEYLCSLRYSAPTDVVIVAATPTGEAAAQQFEQMYEYFHSKNRYGVLGNKGTGNIRDTYLVPVPPSPSNLPDFIINLEGHKVPENRSEPMILVALVIRNDYHPEANRSFDGTVEAQSPSVMGNPQLQMSMSGAGPAMSPIAPQGSFQGPPSQPMISPEEAHRRAQQEEKHILDQRAGEETAAKILGPHVNAPTVHFLMPQAYQMRPLEWEVIRDILEKDQKAQTDLQHLSQVLEVRMAAETNKPAQS